MASSTDAALLRLANTFERYQTRRCPRQQGSQFMGNDFL